jgi:hypothetical protein
VGSLAGHGEEEVTDALLRLARRSEVPEILIKRW